MLANGPANRDVSKNQAPTVDALTLGMIERIPFEPSPDAPLCRAAFVARFNIRVLGETQVALTIPKGASRFDLISEAQEIAKASDLFRHVAQPAQLEAWGRSGEFTTPVEEDTHLAVDCRVEGSGGMTLQQQESFLLAKGLSIATFRDLAVAHVAFSVATEWKDPFVDGLYHCTVRGKLSDGAVGSEDRSCGTLQNSPLGLTDRCFLCHDSRAQVALRVGACLKSS